jgi:16S rRNA (uracil1498-N3)-methyltransferase
VTPSVAAELRRSAAHVLVDDVRVPVLDDRADHHVHRVLRVRDGEVVSVTDGAGSWRLCRSVRGVLVPESDVSFEELGDGVTIGFAVPKQDRPEWIVQKLTELGIARIVVLHADRSVVRWDAQRAEKHLDKLRRVAIEAAQQSRRVWLPVVEGPIAADELLPLAAVAEPGGRSIEPADRVFAVGPEGGWSDRELAVARDVVSLGDTILRVETAALTIAARAFRHTE